MTRDRRSPLQQKPEILDDLGLGNKVAAPSPEPAPAPNHRPANVNTARLTVDITPQLKSDLRVLAAHENCTIAELVRGQLEQLLQ
jgi:hypothetical protein